MKNADCVDQAISDTVDDEMSFLGMNHSDLDYYDTSHEIKKNVNDAVSKWVKSLEYLTVIIDTEKDTCTVVPNK